ncbi:MAG: flagellar biosynthetic protein FliR [Spirochaetales bacterium]|nr:flagellar biosynthetic protein FliR [Spirochaetales bacterium]
MMEVAPLLSSSAIPQIAKVGISLFVGIVIFPGVVADGYPLPDDFIHYALLVIGEALIGIIIGFFLYVVYSSFQVAGQFFSLQMGFGASEVFDPLAQIEIPLLGQFFNLVAMLIFVATGGFQKFIVVGMSGSFKAIKAINIVIGRERILSVFMGSLGRLFESALMISFPILGTLFIISISVGLLAKAAPQMNLLMMGFPIAIGVAFLIIFATIPFLMETFRHMLDAGFEGVSRLILGMKGGGG